MYKRWIVLTVGLLVVGFLLWIEWQAQSSSAEQRLRLLAGIPASAHVTPDTARQQLLQQLPPGTDEEHVYRYLEQHLGSDEHSSYSRADADGRIVCRIGYNPNTFGFAKASFGIFFILDRAGRLQDIEVERWLTGV